MRSPEPRTYWNEWEQIGLDNADVDCFDANLHLLHAVNQRIPIIPEKGHVLFPAGHFSRVSAALADRGHFVERTAHRMFVPLMSRQAAELPGASYPIAKELLEALSDAPRALYFASTAAERRDCTLAIAATLPQSNMLILASRQTPLSDLWRWLAAMRNIHPVHGRAGDSPYGHVFLHTPQQAYYFRYPRIDVVIVQEPRLLLYRDTLPLVRHWGYGPMRIAYAPLPNGLRENDYIQIEGVFGPMRSSTTSRRTKVIRTTFSGYAPVADQNFQRCRDAFWENRSRNEMIAQLASSIAEGDFDDPLVRRLGVLPRQPRVGVLVAAARHAENLGNLLPDWQVLIRSAEADAPHHGPRQVAPTIATFSAVKDARDLFDLLILADGCQASWPLPRLIKQRDRETVILDVVDAFDPKARKDGQSRASDYQNRGWDISELDT